MEERADTERYDHSRHCICRIAENTIDTEYRYVEVKNREFNESIGSNPEKSTYRNGLEHVSVCEPRLKITAWLIYLQKECNFCWTGINKMLASCSSNCTFLRSDHELYLLQIMSELTQNTKDEHASYERLYIMSRMTRIRKFNASLYKPMQVALRNH